MRKDAKKAIIGALITIGIGFISFMGKVVYEYFTEVPNLSIAEVKHIYQYKKHMNNIPPMLKSQFKSYGENMLDKKNDFDAILKLIYLDNLSKDEIATILSSCQRIRNNFTGVKLCNTALSKLENGTINPCDLGCLGIEKAAVYENSDRDKIKYILNLELITQKAIQETYDVIFDSITVLYKEKNARTGKLDFEISVSNSGKSKAMINTNAIINFNG